MGMQVVCEGHLLDRLNAPRPPGKGRVVDGTSRVVGERQALTEGRHG